MNQPTTSDLLAPFIATIDQALDDLRTLRKQLTCVHDWTPKNVCTKCQLHVDF